MRWYELGCGDTVSSCEICGKKFGYFSRVETGRDLNIIAHPGCMKKAYKNYGYGDPLKPEQKRKVISMTEYSKKMDKIIKKGLPVPETLIELLEEASKYNVKRGSVAGC